MSNCLMCSRVGANGKADDRVTVSVTMGYELLLERGFPVCKDHLKILEKRIDMIISTSLEPPVPA